MTSRTLTALRAVWLTVAVVINLFTELAALFLLIWGIATRDPYWLAAGATLLIHDQLAEIRKAISALHRPPTKTVHMDLTGSVERIARQRKPDHE